MAPPKYNNLSVIEYLAKLMSRNFSPFHQEIHHFILRKGTLDLRNQQGIPELPNIQQ